MKRKTSNRKDLDLFIRAIKLIKPYKTNFIFVVLCVIVSVILGLVQPALWGKLVARLFKKNADLIIYLLLLLLLLFLTQTIFNYLQSYLFSFLKENVINDLKNKIFNKIMSLPVAVFDKLGIGTLMSRLHEDTSVIANIITDQLVSTFIDIIKVIIIGILIFSINPILALITLIMFPISYMMYAKFGDVLHDNSKQIKTFYDYYFSNVQESFSAFREIKCLGVKEKRIESFSQLSFKLKQLNIKNSILIGLVTNLSMFINYLAQIVIYSVGAYLTFKNLLKIEYFIAFAAYSQQFSSSLTNIIGMNAKIKQAFISLDRIFTIIDELDFSSECFGKLNIDKVDGNIKFSDVNFGYDDTRLILKNLTFNVYCNRKYLIVGSSGSGKSTIFNLLLRFYDPKSGEITIDNINIKELSEKSLRKYISIVRQDTVLFNTSIRNNLLLANPNATDEEIEEACKIADIHDFITGLINGYNSLVSGNGSNFSGGQKQRFAIARAILKKSPIILFDEATSSLDSKSQYEIKNSINKLSRNHTIILITHKLIDIIDADEIFVIDNGVIVGQGTHDYLMRNNEQYRKLCKYEIKALNNI